MDSKGGRSGGTTNISQGMARMKGHKEGGGCEQELHRQRENIPGKKSEWGWGMHTLRPYKVCARGQGVKILNGKVLTSRAAKTNVGTPSWGGGVTSASS